VKEWVNEKVTAGGSWTLPHWHPLRDTVRALCNYPLLGNRNLRCFTHTFLSMAWEVIPGLLVTSRLGKIPHHWRKLQAVRK
jgi:hypothetical protein